jgi:NTE family protein
MDNDDFSILQKVPFFSHFREDEVALLRPHFREVSLRPDEVLFHQGDAGDALYVLLGGQVHLVQTQDGRDRVLAILGRRGDALGEMALLTSEARPATAVAVQPARLLVLKTEDFNAALRTTPTLALAVTRFLSGRLAQAIRPPAVPNAAKVYTLVAAAPFEEQAVLVGNLAVSLMTQTRRKLLIVDLPSEGGPSYKKTLKLPCPSANRKPDAQDFQSVDTLRPWIASHPSGLDVLCLPRTLLEGDLAAGVYPLLETLRREWDYVLVPLGDRPGRILDVLVEEADRVFYVREEGAEPGTPMWRQLEKAVPPQRLDLVELQRESPPRRHRPGRFYIPWGPNLGRNALAAGAPFLDRGHEVSQRGVDRWARHLGGLRTGLALGSGAALGYSAIGVLRVLERHGVFPDLIAGTSMGALIGSFYCAGRSVDELEDIARSITKAKLWTLMDFALPWKGVVVGNAVLRFLRSILGDVTFGELALPFACVATDINTGEERVLRHGPVAEAVRASLSLPFFFEPFFLKGRYLVDGGLVNPVPTSVVRAMGADVAISLNITTRPAIKRFPGWSSRKPSAFNPLSGPHIFKVMAKTMYTMQYGIAKTTSAAADVVLAPDLSAYTWLEFHHAPEIIKIAEDYTEGALAKITAPLPFFSDRCRTPLRAPRPRL